MTPMPLRPFCVSKESDIALFDQVDAIFAAPAARRAGLTGLLRTYKVVHGVAEPTSEATAITDGTGTELSDEDQSELAFHLGSPIFHRRFDTDMTFISTTGITLLASPGMVIMQAQNPALELVTAKSFSQDLQTSTWARTACATIRFAPPATAHARLALVARANRQLALLQELRPAGFAEMARKGCTLTPVEGADIAAALSENALA